MVSAMARRALGDISSKSCNRLAIMANMQTQNHANNLRLCELLHQSGMTQAVAMTLFNRGRRHPVTESMFKAWMAPPDAPHWRALADDDLAWAQAALATKAITS